jgi:hypothetical protein
MQWRNHLKRWHLSWIRRVRIGLIRPCLPRRPIGGAVRWRAQPVGAGSAFMARQRRRSAVENRGSRPPPFQKAVDSQPKGCIYWSTAYWLQAGLRHHEPAPQWRALYFMIVFYVDEAGDPYPHDEPLFDWPASDRQS